jgi:hypothetical protein
VKKTIASFALISVMLGCSSQPVAPTAPAQGPEPAAESTSPPSSTPEPASTQRPPAPAGAFSITTEFNGVQDPDGYSGLDASIAAGPHSLVLVMNSMVGIVQKDGSNLIPLKMQDFFPHRDQGTDPRVLFDPQTQRFFIVKADYRDDASCSPRCGGVISLAVSKSDDPQSLGVADWYFYSLDRSIQMKADETIQTDLFGDFDTLSIANGILAITWDVDSYEGYLGPGGQLRLIEIQPLVDGMAPAQWLDIVDLPGHVAKALSDADSFFIVGGHPGEYQIWNVDASLQPGEVTYQTMSTNLSNLPSGNMPDAAQPQGAPVDVPAGPKTQAIYLNGSLWVAQDVGQELASGTVSYIHWAQIDVSNWPNIRVVQSGLLGDESAWFYSPALMVDSAGNMAMVYHRSGPNEYVSAFVTGRLVDDPLGSLRPSEVLYRGDVSYERIQGDRNRFVDYIGITIDPVDGSVWEMVFYPQGEYRSGSWVGNFSFTSVR